MKFVVIQKVCRAIKQRVHMTPAYQKQLPCVRARVLGLPYKEILPPNFKIFSLAKREFCRPQ